jgi:hypothetical protein
MSDASIPHCEPCNEPEYACRCRCEHCGGLLTKKEVAAYRALCGECVGHPYLFPKYRPRPGFKKIV